MAVASFLLNLSCAWYGSSLFDEGIGCRMTDWGDSKEMTGRLWEKGEEIDSAVHAFTVGNDPEIDLRIVRWDIVASAAHARMLRSIKVLSEEDLQGIIGALQEAHTLALEGRFIIPRELEDCHTALEGFLTDRLGEVGKRVHAGRSRNDQVLVTMRLATKDLMLTMMERLAACAAALLKRSAEVDGIPLPGYTHMQPAMPSGVDMWCQSFAEWCLELLGDGFRVLSSIDSNPLGTGSGFGVTLPLDRDLTTKLLGFARVQRNPIHAQNSRGRMELKALRWLEDGASLVEKFAWDTILFASREYGFFKLPVQFTTGSSIMPQKRNPDVLELMRGSAARIRGAAREVEYVIAKLPSSYHRDFQLTKDPVIRAFDCAGTIFSLLAYVADRITVDSDRISSAMTDDLYATYHVFRQVKDGVPFRDAYKDTAARLGNDTMKREILESDYAMIQDSLRVERAAALSELGGYESELKEKRKHLLASEERALGTVN